MDNIPDDLLEKVQDPTPVVTILLTYDLATKAHRATYVLETGQGVMVERDTHTGLWSLYGIRQAMDLDTYTKMEGAFDVPGSIESFFDGDLTFGIYRGEEE